MCRRVNCPGCGRPSYAGCGLHVEQVLAGVAAAERCQCKPARPTDGIGALLARLFRGPKG